MRILHIFRLIPLLALAACTEPPLSPYFMVIEPTFVETLPANPALDNSITLGSVTVAADAVGDASVVGVVTPEALRQALLNALMTAGFHQRDKTAAKYVLNADLNRLEQSGIGWEQSAIASIRYSLLNQKTQQEIYAETISIPFTMGVGEVFDGRVRSRMVTGKSIAEGITHLLRKLSTLNSK